MKEGGSVARNIGEAEGLLVKGESDGDMVGSIDAISVGDMVVDETAVGNLEGDLEGSAEGKFVG